MIGPPPPPPPFRQYSGTFGWPSTFGISNWPTYFVGRITRIAGGVELVRAGSRRHVHDAATRATHFRIVGVQLNLHFLNRFDARIGRRTVRQVGHRETVDQEIVRPHAAAAHRDGGVADLILHPVPVRVGTGLDRRRQVGHEVDAAAAASESFQAPANRSTPPVDALVVSISGDCPVTVMLSSSVPISSVTSRPMND